MSIFCLLLIEGLFFSLYICKRGSPCHLLNLPPEVRLLIYEHCFPVQDLLVWQINIDEIAATRISTHSQTPSSPNIFSDVLALLCTCQTVFSEAAPILYRKQHFRFPGDAFDTDFLPAPFNNRTICANVRRISIAATSCDAMKRKRGVWELSDAHVELARLCPSLLRFQIYLPCLGEIWYGESCCRYRAFLMRKYMK